MPCIPVNIVDSIIRTLDADGRFGSDLVEVGFFEREDLDHQIDEYHCPPNPILWEKGMAHRARPSHGHPPSVTARREVK